MSRIWGLLVPRLHFFIIAWLLYDGYLMYEEFLSAQALLGRKIQQLQRRIVKNKQDQGGLSHGRSSWND